MTTDLSNETPFVIGASLTASEVEGVSSNADWSRWISRGRAPESKDGAGFRETWSDDLGQLASIGVDEVMLTLEWARLWPTAAAPDNAEIEFRRDLLTRARELGMRPWACLVDGTLPGWFAEDERGFGDDKARGLIWPRHVDWIGETFSDLVDGWVPIREPAQWAAWGHLIGATPPGNQRRRDMQRMVTAGERAELDAERLLRGSAPVATHVTGRTVIGRRDNVKAAPHANWLDEHLVRHWLRELSDGAARESFDRIIVQLRPGIVIDDEGAWSALDAGHGVEALLDPLERIAAAAGDREIIASADLAGVSDDGSAQADHLTALIAGATERGATGWWQSSPLDGWHWQHGFSRTPGLLDRDREWRAATEVLISASGASK